MNTTEEEETQKLTQDGVKGIVVWYLMVIIAFLTLIICSGKLEWINAWIYLIISIGYLTIIFIVLGIKNPEILNERGKLAKKGTKPFDRIFYVLYLPMVIISMAIMAWDAQKYQWSVMPFWTVILGVIMTIPGSLLGLWAMFSNPFFELTVRIQEDRDHQVITSGPYKIIRHPGYAGEILNLLATPFLLNSGWGFVPMGVMILVFIIRTALEDRTLRKDLSGYEEFTKRTQYRLIPYIW